MELNLSFSTRNCTSFCTQQPTVSGTLRRSHRVILFTVGQRSFGETMFSVTSICQSVILSACLFTGGSYVITSYVKSPSVIRKCLILPHHTGNLTVPAPFLPFALTTQRPPLISGCSAFDMKCLLLLYRISRKRLKRPVNMFHFNSTVSLSFEHTA